MSEQPDAETFSIEETCCGKCFSYAGGACYVDQITGERNR